MIQNYKEKVEITEYYPLIDNLDLKHVKNHVLDVGFQKLRLVRNQTYQLRKRASEVASFEDMQEHEDADHDHAEELVEHRGPEEQEDHADDGVERHNLDIRAGRQRQ